MLYVRVDPFLSNKSKVHFWTPPSSIAALISSLMQPVIYLLHFKSSFCFVFFLSIVNGPGGTFTAHLLFIFMHGLTDVQI